MATPATILDQMLPTVALVGRVNVGKSTLFNKILEYNLAMVSSLPGTTRTRNIATATWRGKQFRLIDTGGLTFADDIPLEADVIHQTELALKEADVIVFVTDIQTGILPQEYELAKRLRADKKKKPIILVANKADNPATRHRVHDTEWQKIRLGEATAVSAANGTGVGDLLDLVFKEFNKQSRRPKTLAEIEPVKIAIVGKPNVGKSSLFNKLIGEDRVIVSDMPHTTREPHDTLMELDDQLLLFVDTAGIRRKTKVSGELERLGIEKSIAAINRADIVLLVLDATEPVTDQDQQLAGLLREHTKSVIIVINKWDQTEDNSDAFRNEAKKDVEAKFPHLNYAPIVFVSAKTGYRVHQIFPLIVRAWEERHIELDEETLKTFLKQATRHHLPTRGKGVRHPSNCLLNTKRRFIFPTCTTSPIACANNSASLVLR
jgi:GTPase